MKNKRAYTVSLSLATIMLTSCGLLDSTPWSWENSTKNFNINYCLLIGQIDHNDSMYRTRGAREILDTRVEKEYQQANFNLEGAKQGTITLNAPDEKYYEYDPSVASQEYKVNELESLEQKSFSGATWDPITANGTAATWINKHNNNITIFISNNDGMAQGAIKAYNWKKYMPIFGYDSNTDALKIMKQPDSSFKGTIDSNTVGQCIATSIIIRNIVEAKKTGLIDKLWNEKKQPYNPIYEGFQYDDQAYADEASKVSEKTINPGDHIDISYGTGYLHSTVTFDGCLNDDLVNNPDSHHAILLKNRSVTNDLYTKKIDDNAIPTDYFFKEDGVTELKPGELYDKAEGSGVADHNPITVTRELEPVSTCQTWYSNTDTFFTDNMDPHFTNSQNAFKISVDYPYPGNGADEKSVLDNLDSALGHYPDGPQAFLINPVQQANSLQYITKIAEKYKIKEKENWIERSDIPIIFWNRQPTDIQGNISSQDVMNNKYFKYTYYVGFDAKQGGELQGQMIRAWLNKTYIENAKGGK